MIIYNFIESSELYESFKKLQVTITNLLNKSK